MIEVHDLVKHFRDGKRGVVKAVDGVSFECRPGEIFGLLGANGAGKTTLLRMLSTVLTPTSGTAIVADYDLIRQPGQVRRSIGFMSSTTALYARLTAGEFIRYIGNLYGLRGADLERRVKYVVDLLEIGDYHDRLCDKLSTGEKQRVSLARTILHDPPVLFFDEPTVGLDVFASRKIREFIQERKEQGKTIVFSTHIMSEAEHLCDRICVIHDGRIAAIGKFEELKAKTGETHLERVFISLVSPTEDPA
ncbi:MAG: ATP-binding cassette domain-containing protein [Armatimonadetes bacterium]|nr:ATP-binding cassette domain-containing protein [Armatimonadota bacterium]